MVHSYKYISPLGLKQEFKLHLEIKSVKWVGVSVYWKRRFLSRFNDIASVYAVTGTYDCTFSKYNKVSAIDWWKYMCGNIWFLKRYDSNNQCTKLQGYWISNTVKSLCRNIFACIFGKYVTLNCRSKHMTICNKVSIKGQGQGHRNKKLAQNVFSFFSFLKFLIQNILRHCIYT